MALLFACLDTCISAPVSSPQSNFLTLPGNPLADWYSYSPSGKKLAIVRTVRRKTRTVGTTLDIYETDATFKPAKKIYSDTTAKRIIFDFEWMGEKLIYPTVLGFDQMNDYLLAFWKTPEKNQESFLKTHLRTQMWNGGSKTPRDLKGIRVSPGDCIFADKKSPYLLIIKDAKNDSAPAGKKRQPVSELEEVTLENWDIATGKVVRTLPAPLPSFGLRRYEGSAQSALISISAAGDRVVVAKKSDFFTAHRGTAYLGPYILTIDLAKGTIGQVNSEAEGQGIALGTPSYHDTGRPMAIGTDLFGCQLETTEASQDMQLRLGYYKNTGQKVGEAHIMSSDLARVGIKIALLVAFTSDRHKIIIQDGQDVWEYDWQLKTGRKLMSNFWIESADQWVNDKALLISGHAVIDKGTAQEPEDGPASRGILHLGSH